MRIAILQVKQETNTFSPVLCTLKDFEQAGLFYHTDFLGKMKGVGEIGGFLAALEERRIDLQLIPILRAVGHAGGRVEQQALDFFEEKLVSGLKAALPLDGIFFSMHGAACSEQQDDMEGYLLAAVRNVVGAEVPVMVTLDHHANITEQMVDLADMIVGYETQPHKPYDTGKKAAGMFFSLLEREYSPVVAWQKIPLIVGYHERLDTAEGEPMKEWFDLARRLEKTPRAISISNFPMQPWMDIREAGLATVVYTDNDPRLARQLAADVGNRAWGLREKFWKSDRLSPEEAVRRAVAADEGPILLADPADTVFGGAPGDSTCLLKEMLRQGITCTALIPMYDPEVVAEAVRVGKGVEITVEVGGKSGTSYYDPVKVTGRITGISEGFEIDPRKGGKHDPGPWGFIIQRRTIVMEVGSVKLLVSENRLMAGIHPDIYRHFGMEPAETKIIVMKTGTNFQFYESIMKGLIRVDCPGVAQADLKQFDWVRAPRPIYPLDAENMDEWQASPSVKVQHGNRKS